MGIQNVRLPWQVVFSFVIDLVFITSVNIKIQVLTEFGSSRHPKQFALFKY